MSAPTAPTNAAPSSTTAAPAQPTNQNPHLLPLQEDDEFEEFPVEDWDQKDTYGAKLAQAAGKAGAGAGGANGTSEAANAKALDSLWEDDWDDDDVADDFSVQLRGELLKQQEQMQS
ncbi:hypothetical protein JCM8097_007351 [Rhodosporidiobolus ruineniae]